MEENRLFELVGKKLSSEASNEELLELRRLLEKYPEALYTVETMEQYWRASGESADRIQREAALERQLQRLALHDVRNRIGIEAPNESETLRLIGPMAPDESETLHLSGSMAPDESEGEPPSGTGMGKRVLRWSAVLAAAAVFACILVIPVLKSKDPIVATVATGRQRQKVLLPDGSTVWLNTQTRLRYSQGRDSVRRVELEGEAYFTVRHDAAHPFIVHTARLEIADLGTSFDVKAYPGDRAAEATLIEGSIEVRLSGQLHGSASGHPPYAAVLNRPRQKIIALVETGTRETGSESVDGESVVGESVGDESGGSESVGGGRTASGNAGSGKAGVEKITVVRDSARTGDHADSLLAETAWMKNMLVFRNESFGDLALRMERWYGVRILFTDSLPARYRFTGALAGEGLEQALEELRLMKPFSYTITGGSVTIKK